jgi:CubicO group peptidase (beta-lactamase class C family)
MTPTVESHALTEQDLDVFFDGLIPYGIQRGGIAGGAVVVVKDGKILYSKGYGYADVAASTPVIPDQTLFRIASVSKTFTWTAVMQLVQAGKLDLDRDVNEYLDFKVPSRFGQPITMRNLMTHTAGFEEVGAQTESLRPGGLTPLREFLIKHMPARIFPPGKIAAYSNYGAMLAGYIVQRVSGEPFQDYITNHVLNPLDMMHSTFAQPLPPELLANMSKGYRQASDPRPIPFENIEVIPAGAMSATVTDMAHFMIAQLSNGSYNGVSILSPAIIALMHSPQSQMAPGINGFDLGFMQENRNGLRIIGHGGDTLVFHSEMELLLDKQIGIFVIFNSAGKDGASGSLRFAIIHGFLDRYFPFAPRQMEVVADPRPDAARVTGWYEPSRRIDSLPRFRLMTTFQQVRVLPRPDGTIEAGKDVISGMPKRWREIGPLTYQDIDGQSLLKFVTDSQGRIEYWTSSEVPPGATEVFQPVHGLYRLPGLKYVGGASLAIWILTLAIWVGGAIVRRRFSHELELPPLARRLRRASRISLALFLFLLGGCWFNPFLLDLSSAVLAAFYLIGVLALFGAVIVVVEAAMRVGRGPGGWLVRAGETVLGLSGLYAAWALFVYGFVSFNFTS